MQQLRGTRKEIVGIDLLRFLCAFSVVISHLANVLPGWASNLGPDGVRIFFVISGFIIPFTAEGSSPFSFVRSRLVRLVPGVWICATLSALALMAYGDHAQTSLLGRYIRTVLFLPGTPFGQSALSDIWISGVYWTLFVEIAFYTIILLVLCGNAFRRLPIVATILSTASLTYWLIFTLAHGFFGSTLWGATVLDTEFARLLDMTLVHHGAWFALGINFWLISKRDPSNRTLSLTLSLLGAAFEIIGRSLRGPDGIVFDLAFCAVGIAMIPLSVAVNETALRRVGTWRRHTIWIGLTTYPLYLIHVPIGKALVGLFAARAVDGWVASVAAITLCTATAALIARYAEPPAQARFRSWITELGLILQDRTRVRFLFAPTQRVAE